MIPGGEVSLSYYIQYSVFLPIVNCKPPSPIFNLLKRVMSKRYKYDLECALVPAFPLLLLCVCVCVFLMSAFDAG